MSSWLFCEPGSWHNNDTEKGQSPVNPTLACSVSKINFSCLNHWDWGMFVTAAESSPSWLLIPPLFMCLTSTQDCWPVEPGLSLRVAKESTGDVNSFFCWSPPPSHIIPVIPHLPSLSFSSRPPLSCLHPQHIFFLYFPQSHSLILPLGEEKLVLQRPNRNFASESFWIFVPAQVCTEERKLFSPALG